MKTKYSLVAGIAGIAGILMVLGVRGTHALEKREKMDHVMSYVTIKTPEDVSRLNVRGDQKLKTLAREGTSKITGLKLKSFLKKLKHVFLVLDFRNGEVKYLKRASFSVRLREVNNSFNFQKNDRQVFLKKWGAPAGSAPRRTIKFLKKLRGLQDLSFEAYDDVERYHYIRAFSKILPCLSHLKILRLDAGSLHEVVLTSLFRGLQEKCRSLEVLYLSLKAWAEMEDPKEGRRSEILFPGKFEELGEQLKYVHVVEDENFFLQPKSHAFVKAFFEALKPSGNAIEDKAPQDTKKHVALCVRDLPKDDFWDLPAQIFALNMELRGDVSSLDSVLRYWERFFDSSQARQLQKFVLRVISPQRIKQAESFPHFINALRSMDCKNLDTFSLTGNIPELLGALVSNPKFDPSAIDIYHEGAEDWLKQPVEENIKIWGNEEFALNKKLRELRLNVPSLPGMNSVDPLRTLLREPANIEVLYLDHINKDNLICLADIDWPLKHLWLDIKGKDFSVQDVFGCLKLSKPVDTLKKINVFVDFSPEEYKAQAINLGKLREDFKQLLSIHISQGYTGTLGEKKWLPVSTYDMAGKVASRIKEEKLMRLWKF